MAPPTRVTHLDLVLVTRRLRMIAICDDPRLPEALREKYRRIADDLTRDLDLCRSDLLHQEVAE